MADSGDPDQIAPLGAVWSGPALFAQAYLSKNLGSLWYILCDIQELAVLNGDNQNSFCYNEPCHKKTCLCHMTVNNKCADQPAHLSSLISTLLFIV